MSAVSISSDCMPDSVSLSACLSVFLSVSELSFFIICNSVCTYINLFLRDNQDHGHYFSCLAYEVHKP